jgi:Protein of unknown function (DUF3667)
MPSTKEIAGDFLRSAFSPSGRILESLRDLLIKPGELTRAYISGQRLRYVHPVRLYLLSVFLFVAANGLNNAWRDWTGQKSFEMDAGQIFAPHHANEETKPQGVETSRKIGEATGKAIKNVLPEWVRDLIKARAARNSTLTQEQLTEKVIRATSSHYSLILALLVPFTAALNWILYLRRRVSYAGHFVYALHGTAASCLLLVPLYALNLPQVYFLSMLPSLIWYVIAARRTFEVSWFGSIWRFLVWTIVGMTLSALLSMVIGALYVLFA